MSKCAQGGGGVRGEGKGEGGKKERDGVEKREKGSGRARGRKTGGEEGGRKNGRENVEVGVRRMIG